MFSIMGLPVLVEFGIVVSLSIILRNYIFHNPEFYEWLKSKFQQALAASVNQFDSEWFFSWIPAYGASLTPQPKSGMPPPFELKADLTLYFTRQ
jgi:hypothetical protein